MPDHDYFANLIWQIADLLRGPYRPPQYERVMLPMTVLRRFDCVLASSKAKVLGRTREAQGWQSQGRSLGPALNNAAGQRFHNHSYLDFEKLKGDPDNIEKHLVSYVKGFSRNVRDIFDFFEFENEIERMREANILYLVVSKFCDVDLHPSTVPNEQMGLIFENLIRRFNELANETAGDHFTPREVIRLMVVFVPLRDASDPETGQRYTVRPLQERKGEGGRLLAPREDHPRARQSGLRADRAHRRGRGKLQVIAELVRVLGGAEAWFQSSSNRAWSCSTRSTSSFRPGRRPRPTSATTTGSPTRWLLTAHP